jgi:hypothetical protein
VLDRPRSWWKFRISVEMVICKLFFSLRKRGGGRAEGGVVCGVGTTHGGRVDEERRENQIALVELLFMYRKLSQGLCYTALRV